jgi:hypothetical protein
VKAVLSMIPIQRQQSDSEIEIFLFLTSYHCFLQPEIICALLNFHNEGIITPHPGFLDHRASLYFILVH